MAFSEKIISFRMFSENAFEGNKALKLSNKESLKNNSKTYESDSQMGFNVMVTNRLFLG